MPRRNVGDYDPSGKHLFNAPAEDVIAFAQTTYNLPTTPPKATDRRSFSGTATTQVEALPPDTLATTVRQAIKAHRDPVGHRQTWSARRLSAKPCARGWAERRPSSTG